MRVEVTLKGSLAERLPGGRGTLELPAGATIENVREALNLPQGPCAYVLNGAIVARDTALSDGHQVQVFLPIAGG